MMNTKEKNLDLGLSLSLNSPWINTTYFISPPAEEIEKEKEDEQRVSSPDSTVSSVSSKLLERSGSDNTGIASDEEDGPGGSCSRKKLRLTKDQSAVLEDCLRAHSTLNPHQKQTLPTNKWALAIDLTSEQLPVSNPLDLTQINNDIAASPASTSQGGLENRVSVWEKVERIMTVVERIISIVTKIVSVMKTLGLV